MRKDPKADEGILNVRKAVRFERRVLAREGGGGGGKKSKSKSGKRR